MLTTPYPWMLSIDGKPRLTTDAAADAVRRRIRRRWERRRAATGAPTVLTVVGVSERRPGRGIRVVANAETVERCLRNPRTAARLFAEVQR